MTSIYLFIALIIGSVVAVMLGVSTTLIGWIDVIGFWTISLLQAKDII